MSFKTLDDYEQILKEKGYEGIPSVVSKEIAKAIQGKKKEAPSIVDCVFDKKIDSKHVFILRFDQLKTLVKLVEESGDLSKPEFQAFLKNIFFSVCAQSEQVVQELGYPLVKDCIKYFSISAEDFNKLIPVQPSPKLLNGLRQ